MSCVNIFRSALVGLLWFGALTLLADTHYVSLAGTNDSGHGYITWSGAATDIQWAVDAAATTVDTVLVSNGTYNLTNQISIVNKSITVRSLYGTNDINTSSIINGNNYDGKPVTNRCVYMLGNNGTYPVLDGFIISNGYHIGTQVHTDSGGGIFFDQAGSILNCIVCFNKVSNTNSYSGGGGIHMRPSSYASIVSNCTVVSNTVLDLGRGDRAGGGILTYYSLGKIISCRISGNQAYSGGGIYTSIGGMLVSNCTVNGNTATSSGGGIYGSCVDCVISNNISLGNGGGMVVFGNAKALNSIIIGNTASNSYGGVYMYCYEAYGVVMVSNCQVIANVASNETGGVYCDGSWGFGVIADSIIAGNVAKQNGGGLYVSSANGYWQKVKNCLIYGNTNSGANGGGVYLNGIGQYPYGLINCTIAGNEAGTKGGGLYATTTNNYIANCIIYGNVTTNAGDNTDEVYVNTTAGTNNFWYNCAPTNLVLAQGNTTNNPLFINAVNRIYRLGSGSPCVNTGTNMNWMTNSIDLDRRIRIRYGTVDMGAYEAIYNGTMYGVR